MRYLLIVALLLGCAGVKPVPEQEPIHDEGGGSPAGMIPLNPEHFTGFVSRNSGGPGIFSTLRVNSVLNFPINTGINWENGNATLIYTSLGFVTLTGSSGILGGGFQLSGSSIVGTAPSGTGITVNTNQTSRLLSLVHRVTIGETALTAAATTQDITIWTVAAATRIERIVAEVGTGFTGGAVSAMTVMCGPSAGSNAYLIAGSVFAAGTLGDVAAEIGAGLTSATRADIPSMSGTTAISCRFTSTSDNVVNATAGSVTFYVEVQKYP